jgi:ribosomal protein S18 acetylase RimI-like enzyme
MNLRFQFDTANIDWDKVVDTLKMVNMAYRTPDVHERAFNKSHSVIFVFDDADLIGFGRVISDGEYQAAMYDVAVNPSYQGKGIGKMIVQKIMEKIPTCNVILYASPGKEVFYEKENFRRMKTGMARFINGERMKNNGFTE